MRRLASGGLRQTSTPSTATLPASGRSRPVTMPSVVVLPAPLGPTRPKKQPCGMSRSIPATASFAPKALRRPLTDRAIAAPSDVRGCSTLTLTRDLHTSSQSGPAYDYPGASGGQIVLIPTSWLLAARNSMAGTPVLAETGGAWAHEDHAGHRRPGGRDADAGPRAGSACRRTDVRRQPCGQGADTRRRRRPL